MQNNFFSRVQNNPIIAAVNEVGKLEPAIASPCEVIFLLMGSICNIKEIVEKAKNAGKYILVHMDLVEGISKDIAALEFISKHVGPDGIITTKSNLVKVAKENDVFAIQRLFILDSLSLDTGIKSIHLTKPDAVEILPGVMPKIISRVHHETRVPLIAGGLINDKEDVIGVLKAGALAVSTSNRSVWYM